MDETVDKTVRRTVDGVISVTSPTVISGGWLNTQSRPIANAQPATPVGAHHLAVKDTSGDTKTMQYIADTSGAHGPVAHELAARGPLR